ncbi:hypothetical protein ABE137_25600 [Brevibacillus laterosporus]|nr:MULTISPECIES: hypothetical protein [Brevibacillus]MCR8985646.1 hypothetical protein [Brevibacillus laterosporus]GIO03806.1 hypothetical protein J5TS2_44740 [Brevibacillus halotolerans]
MSFGSLFGGGGLSSKDQSHGQTETRSDGTYLDGYKVADESDMEWLSNVLG